MESLLRDTWLQALDHSGLSGDDFYLLACPGTAVDGYAKGATYPPGIELVEDEFLTGGVLVDANKDEHRAKHRIAVFEDVDAEDPVAMAILAGTLRHEIEHARQRMVCGGALFDVDECADVAIGLKAGDLPESLHLYRLKPIEQDANAAAAMLLRNHFSGLVEAVLESTDAALVQSHAPPGRPESLLARTVCFIFLFAGVVEKHSRIPNGVSFDRRLDALSTDAGDLWRHLQQAAERGQE